MNETIKHLSDAGVILDSIGRQLTAGAMYPYEKILHAKVYINTRIAEEYEGYFADDEAL